MMQCCFFSSECIPYHSAEARLPDLKPTFTYNYNVTNSNGTEGGFSVNTTDDDDDNNNNVINPAAQTIHLTPRLMSSAYQTETQEASQDGVYVIPDRTRDSNNNNDDDVLVITRRSVKNNDAKKHNTILAAKDGATAATTTIEAEKEAGSNNHVTYDVIDSENSTVGTTAFNRCLSVPELGRYVPSGRAFQVEVRASDWLHPVPGSHHGQGYRPHRHQVPRQAEHRHRRDAQVQHGRH